MKNILFVLLLIPLFISCSARNVITNSGESKDKNLLAIYRVPLNELEGQKIWIIDGSLVREKIYPEFLYGGNDERYTYIPKNEIWIDNAITVIEYEYTLRHELHERYLMAARGWSYSEAHDSSLALELHMRRHDLAICKAHEKSLHLVSPTDCDNIKEIHDLPDSIRIEDIYRIYLGKRNGLDIWVVDGANVRRDIFPDFGLSGNDLAYKFIPRNEIWIDSDISCEETEFSITCELKERSLLKKGINYDDAYTQALKEVEKQRTNAFKIAAKHPTLIIPKVLERETGTGKLNK